MPPRGAASLAARFGTTSASQRKLGVTRKQLEAIVAVAACELVHGGHPTRSAVQQVSGVSDKLFGEAVRAGHLEALGRTEEGFAIYATTARGKDLLARALGEVVAAE